MVAALAARAHAATIAAGSPSDWQTNVPIDAQLEAPGDADDVFTLEGDAEPEALWPERGAAGPHLVRLVPAHPLLPLHTYTLRLRGVRVVTFVTGTQLAGPLAAAAPPPATHHVSMRSDPQPFVARRLARGLWLLAALAGLVLLFELARWTRYWLAQPRA
jgi:hypothetical protein